MESGMSQLGYPSRPGSPNVDSGRDLFLFTTSPAGISQMTGSQMSILDCICSFSEICQLGYPSRPGRWNLKSGRVSFLFQISKWPYGPPGPQNVKNRQIAKTDQTWSSKNNVNCSLANSYSEDSCPQSRAVYILIGKLIPKMTILGMKVPKARQTYYSTIMDLPKTAILAIFGQN